MTFKLIILSEAKNHFIKEDAETIRESSSGQGSA